MYCPHIHKHFNFLGLKIKFRDKPEEICRSINERDVFYIHPASFEPIKSRGFDKMEYEPDFRNRVLKNIENVDEESMETYLKIIHRSHLLSNPNFSGQIYTGKEQDDLRKIYDFQKDICRIDDHLYSYKSYLLPICHFETGVFLTKHGMHRLENMSYFANKDIIDAGGFIGDSALIFSPLTSQKVYSFEAAKNNYDMMLQTIKLNHKTNIVPVHKALGATTGELEISFNAENDSCGTGKKLKDVDYAHTEKTEMTTLDQYVDEHQLHVGLIKVDIEGFEQEFLKGARHTIENQKPTMLISIYHNVSDFLDIKPLIESWNLGYLFKFYRPTSETAFFPETLLICEMPK